MDGYKDYRQAEMLTAREVQEILKVGNKTVYRLFAGDCPFRVVKVPGAVSYTHLTLPTIQQV